MAQNGSTFISCIRMDDSGSSHYSSVIDDDYDLSLSTSLSSKANEEICSSSPPLEMEVRPYHFDPDQESDFTICYLAYYSLAISKMEFTALLFVSFTCYDHVGNTDWCC